MVNNRVQQLKEIGIMKNDGKGLLDLILQKKSLN